MTRNVTLNLRVWHGPPAVAAAVKEALERRFQYQFETRPIDDDGYEVRVNILYGPYDLVSFTEEEARIRAYAVEVAANVDGAAPKEGA